MLRGVRSTGDENLPLLAQAGSNDPRTYVYQQHVGNAYQDKRVSGLLEFDVLNGYWIQTDTSARGRIVIALNNLPSRCKVTEVTATIDGNGGGASHSDLPSLLPLVQLVVHDGAGTATIVGSDTDDSADLSEYEVPHPLVIPANQGVDGSKLLYLNFEGESGSNSLDDALALLGVKVDVEVDRIGP